MKRVRLALAVALLTLASVAPSLAIEEYKTWKITCPDGSQHLFGGTYNDAREFASIVC